MKSRNQYLEELIRKNGGYHLKSKKGKTRLLNEYCRVTGQNRKYMIRKLRKGLWVHQERRKKSGRQRKRESYYDSYVTLALIKCWEIFDYPCGQRLAPLLKTEAGRLCRQKELSCSNTVAKKLKEISPRTIDEKLKSHKEKESLKHNYSYKNNPLLYQKIPVKLSIDWKKENIGNIQIDLVEHCGRSAHGEYVYTLSTTDIITGWWEGSAQLSRSQKATMDSIKKTRKHYPIDWRAMHTDNDSTFINWHLYHYAKKQKLDFSRSRPYRKNDNCFVEQKNSTHVRRCVGYYRYDTKKELQLLNNFYSNELRLYKNFFQPVIKLVYKERVNGHIKRKYDEPKTPYQRIMEHSKTSKQTKQQLKETYESLNPAQLKRNIDKKLKLLKQTYDAKQGRSTIKKAKKLNTNTVTFLNRTTEVISVT